MKKNLSFFLFLIWAVALLPLSYAVADDMSDVMDAALDAQSRAQVEKPAVSAQATASLPQPSSLPPTEKSVVPSVPESNKVKNVLATEEKVQHSVTAVSPQLTGDENTENFDEDGKPISPKESVLEEAATKGELMLADFDSGDKPNNLGGDFGGFTKDPSDDTQDCRATFASDDALGNTEGFALRLDYDVDSPSPAYNGFWMKLENLNATPYDTLSFYVRGVSKRFTKRIKVELKTPDYRSSSFFVSGINDQWQKIEVPLKRFKGIKDWSILSELVLVFDDVNTAPKKGTLLIDQMMLERKENGMKSVAAASPVVDPSSQPPEPELPAV